MQEQADMAEAVATALTGKTVHRRKQEEGVAP